MKLKAVKKFGKLKEGDFHDTVNDAQGKALIKAGLAEKASDEDFEKSGAPKAHKPDSVDRSKNKK